MHFIQTSLLSLLLAPHTLAYPAAFPNQRLSSKLRSLSELEARALQNGISLRVLPLGASISQGVASSDGNGYRNLLHNKLTDAGNPVNFVGSKQDGNMKDNDNSGYPGALIEGVESTAVKDGTFDFKPNVVLINVGTNNCAANGAIDSMINKMSSLLNRVQSSVNGVTIVLSSLVPNRDAGRDQCAQNFNTALQGLITSRSGAGQKILYVNMYKGDGVQANELASDGIHPNDTGYSHMANVWFDGISQAATRNWIVTPDPSGKPDAD